MSPIVLTPVEDSGELYPPLLTPDDVRNYLKTEVEDDPSAEWIDLVIAGVSNSIAKRTGRDYSGSTDQAPAERTFQRFGDDATVPIDDCREVTKVEVGSDGNWVEIDGTDWTTEPTSKDPKARVRFANPDLPATGVGWFFPNPGFGSSWPKHSSTSQAVTAVRVTALWGTGGVPANVRLAALMWISSIHKRDQAYFSENFAQGAATILDIPPDVMRMINDEEGDGFTGVGAV